MEPDFRSQEKGQVGLWTLPDDVAAMEPDFRSQEKPRPAEKCATG